MYPEVDFEEVLEEEGCYVNDSNVDSGKDGIMISFKEDWAMEHIGHHTFIIYCPDEDDSVLSVDSDDDFPEDDDFDPYDYCYVPFRMDEKNRQYLKFLIEKYRVTD